MAEITLIAPPSPYLADDRASPPLGLLYAAGALERAGISVEVLDLASLPDWEARVSAVTSPIVGVNCVSPNYQLVRRVAELIHEDAIKIIGGPHPSAVPEKTFGENVFDVIVAGESETIIADLVRRLLRGEKTERIVYGPPTPPDQIALPARHLIDLRNYTPEMNAQSSTTLISSRGCPFNCGFCYKMYDSRLVRYHPVSIVEREIDELVNRYGYRNIVFTDDNFIANRKHFKTIAATMKNHGIHYRCMGRTDCMNDEILKTLLDTGCQEISFGAESGSQRILDNMNKRMDVAKQKQVMLDAKRAGLLVKAFFVVGFPGEDETTIEETKRFFEEVMPHKWLLSTFCPLPGSDTSRNPEKYGIKYLSEDFSEYWYVGSGGLGGQSFETDTLTRERVHDMNRELFNFFQSLVPTSRSEHKK
jgi:anaerobic magnesium-protoporphyrin IX monomethyl ester cyclase